MPFMLDLDHTHDWVWREDWEGDPRIPNGTHDTSCWVCKECGEEISATEMRKYDSMPWLQ